MAEIKPIKVWLTPSGPNPWKVILVLEELSIPYEMESFPFPDVKKESYLTINPNGRVPAINDPNTGITLWESGAIILYLVEQYDKEGKLTYESLRRKNEERQWLMFQVSGQGPYFGQAGWFTVLHAEKIPSAISRYTNEVRRILGVLDGHLAKTGTGYLVGDKLTYADLVFVPYNDRVDALTGMSKEEVFGGYENVVKWHEKMLARESWKKSMEVRARLMDEQGLQWNGMPKGVNNMEEYMALLKKG
ncbi:glutathione S-transferase [Massariosphaeria phaeospora]|uniref:glutathione transferase n=1 Tax=Massariosphaeria phaeospora TaxID=100035 RepID=A0A7C8MNX5_9PLEO|nr:glutathione S-transferase [Massariosphaeria phaeospora]